MAGNNVELIDNASRIADSRYIRTAVSRNITPSVSIKASPYFSTLQLNKQP